jgi:hypothetical protein
MNSKFATIAATALLTAAALGSSWSAIAAQPSSANGPTLAEFSATVKERAATPASLKAFSFTKECKRSDHTGDATVTQSAFTTCKGTSSGPRR